MKYWQAVIMISLLCSNYVEAEQASSATKKNKPKKTQVTQSQAIIGSKNLVTEINHILQGLDSKAAIGIHIKSMKHGDTLYVKNEQRLFTPASIVKILTAEAALLYLGAEYKFPTTLLTDAKQMDNGFIKGNIYLVQTGDPSLTYYDLTDLMVTLKAQQIHGISGNVYIDNSAYDNESIGPGWSDSDTQYCFAAPISASIINHNCLSFQVAPAKTIGKLANIIESPRYYYGDIENTVMTKNPNTKSCYVYMNTSSETLSVSGCVLKGREPWGVTTVISDTMEYNKSLLHNLFKRYGIQVTGAIDAGEVKTHLSTIAVHHSKPLHSLINEMLKKSDNVIAGSLLKKMGEFHSRQPGSWSNGGEAIKQILSKKAAVDSKDMTIIDGSGLSRENQVKPAQMMQVLDFAYHHYGTNYEFISSLPIAGRDGTLKNRLRNVARKVRAKTGTMSGVVSLAGYVVTDDKEPLAFVIIVNGQNGNVWKYREVEDKIVTALTHYSR